MVWTWHCVILESRKCVFLNLSYTEHTLTSILTLIYVFKKNKRFSDCSVIFRKGILEEYSEITSLLTDEIVKVHKEIHTSIDQIDPVSEYEHFIEVHR